MDLGSSAVVVVIFIPPGGAKPIGHCSMIGLIFHRVDIM